MNPSLLLILTTLFLTLSSLKALAESRVTPTPNWADSYSANGKCYCASTFDHGVRTMRVVIKGRSYTVSQACAIIGPGPGKGNNPVYNTVQCGHEPAHRQRTVRNLPDEKECPGRVDRGRAGCTQLGPKWDTSKFRQGPGPKASARKRPRRR